MTGKQSPKGSVPLAPIPATTLEIGRCDERLVLVRSVGPPDPAVISRASVDAEARPAVKDLDPKHGRCPNLPGRHFLLQVSVEGVQEPFGGEPRGLR